MKITNWCLAVATATLLAAYSTGVRADDMTQPNTAMQSGNMAAGISPAGIDYTVLTNPRFDYLDIQAAKTAGLSDDDIAAAAKIADVDPSMTFNDVVAAFLRGETYATVADEAGISPLALLDLSGEKAKIANYRAAYMTTGSNAIRSMVMGNRMARYTVNGQVVTTDQDIVQLANNNESLSMFTKAVKAANLTNVLKGPGPFTVFAPSDAAFAALPAGYLDSLMNDPTRLRNVLLYHVIPGRIDSQSAMAMTSPTSPPTVEGATLQVTTANGNVLVNGAKVIVPDMAATNGIIHEIDAILIPPTEIAPSTTAPGTTTAPNATTAPGTTSPNVPGAPGTSTAPGASGSSGT